MSHIINFKSMLTIAVVFSVAFAAPNKLELSNVTDESESSVTENDDSVSAITSIRDLNEGASLANKDNGTASADGNGDGASSGNARKHLTGFINVSEVASTEVPMKSATGMLTKPAIIVLHLFGKIIEIPINVLQYINTYFNQKLMHRGQPGAAVSSDESAGASGNEKAGASMMVPSNSIYDAIFNIPITVLRSIQNLFNKLTCGRY